MRNALVVGLTVLLVGCGPGRLSPASSSTEPVVPKAPEAAAAPPDPDDAPPQVDFASQVQPILEARCQPCHFAGGKMYEQLPFDRQETIHQLGERLFTRITDAQEQSIIRAFLAQSGE